MKISHKFGFLSVLLFFTALLGCDVSQFDPSKHRARYEAEREAAKKKPANLTKTGELPQEPAKEQSPSPDSSPKP